MRSKLFVPATRPELFAKAQASQAEALSFDLEDAVSEPRKAEARKILAAYLVGPEVRSGGKVVIVRVNAVETSHFDADIDAVVQAGVDIVNLPKPDSPDEVRLVASRIARAEARNGVTTPLRLLLNIETPKALRNAAALATADARVIGLQLGLGDMFEPYGIGRREAVAVQQAMFALRMAAAEAGVYAYDSAFADIRDAAGFREEATLARNLGFIGKTCIHPSQIALANEVFRPTDAEIAHALRVVAAADSADAKGVGAYVVDGKMIDGPFIERARAIVQSARALGLLTGDRN